MTPELAENTALIVVDVQRGFADPYWGRRNNPDCERNVGRLIDHWRHRKSPLVYVRHDSLTPGSPLATGSHGNAFHDVVTGEPDLLVSKHVNSAFYGTPDLDRWLRDAGISTVVICGITTNHCCETTARMAGNLGYDVYFVSDATCTFNRSAPDGRTVEAAVLQRATETSLHGEFATVVLTETLLG